MRLRNFGKGLKRARKKAGMTQEAFAKDFNVHLQTVRNWEQGKAMPPLDTLCKIADYFSCDIDYLMDSIPCPTRDKSFLCAQTGLTEDAIDTIRNNPDELETLLTHPDFESLLSIVKELQDSSLVNTESYISALVALNADTALADNDQFSRVNLLDVKIFNATRVLSNILNDIARRNHNG